MREVVSEDNEDRPQSLLWRWLSPATPFLLFAVWYVLFGMLQVKGRAKELIILLSPLVCAGGACLGLGSLGRVGSGRKGWAVVIPAALGIALNFLMGFCALAMIIWLMSELN